MSGGVDTLRIQSVAQRAPDDEVDQGISEVVPCLETMTLLFFTAQQRGAAAPHPALWSQGQ